MVQIKDMVKIDCRAVVEEEDLDVICGHPQISGKEQALQMEKNINEKIYEKSRKRGGGKVQPEKDPRPGTANTNAGI